MCKQHLRRIFWEERLWELYFRYELDIDFGMLKPRDMIDLQGRHIAWSQELLFTNPLDGNKHVVRAQWYLTGEYEIAASGAPDPKEINWKGVNTHIHQRDKTCELCDAGDPLPPAIND